MQPPQSYILRVAACAMLPLGLGGCKMDVLFPAGDVARQQAHLLAVSTLLMLLIIVPVMVLTVLFAWRYRQGNDAATYRPDWDHSTALELVIWSAPLAIVIALGAITWMSTHLLDPYRRLGRIGPGHSVAVTAKPLEIQVVALDWKWLFIYPELGIATVNELALPVNREVRFRLTASSVMNSFYVPALAGQIYAMPAMETKLHAVLNRQGRYEGFSANYSGAGFSGMHFPVIGVDEAGFARWVTRQKAAGGMLSRANYLVLAQPSEDVPARHWASIDPALFDRIVNMCVRAGALCMRDTMMADMRAMPCCAAKTPSHDIPNRPPGEPKGALLRTPLEKGSSSRPRPVRPDAPALPSHM
jgi:cytochrome o ubiquinol oxidase subunit 2